MKTISILIAAYQAQQWLNDCLSSIVSQRLPVGWQMEILIGIDGCINTRQWVTECWENHPPNIAINVFFSPLNNGTYITFNTLCTYAKGELICRFDADDVMRPNYLVKQMALFEAGVDLTRTWSIYTDENLNRTAYVLAHNIHYKHGGFNTKPADGQFIVTRNALTQLGGLEGWRCAADTEFRNRFALAGFKTGVVEEHLYLRRNHKHSLTTHPDSNYQSSLRHTYQTLLTTYQQEYCDGNRSLTIQPKKAKDVQWLTLPKRTATKKPGTTGVIKHHAQSANDTGAPMLVVLDIDETLLHASTFPLTNPCDYKAERTWVYKRPYVDGFLRYCQQNFLVGVWTSARASYAQEIVEQVFPYLSLVFVFNETHCESGVDENGHIISIKPLNKLATLGFDLSQIVMIDDSPEKHSLNPANLLQVAPFFASEREMVEDQGLAHLQRQLDRIKDCKRHLHGKDTFCSKLAAYDINLHSLETGS